MRVITIIVFFLHILFAQEMNYKMIVSSHVESQKAAKNLYEIENFFSENKEAKEIKAKYNLTLGMELLDKYIIITIKPIRMTSVKNELQYVLQKAFPESFIVGNMVVPKQQKIQKQIKSVPHVSKIEQHDKVVIVDEPKEKFDGFKLFWKDLDSEWLGLLFLAFAGFILVYRSAKQISKIKELQQEVTNYQNNLEKEVDDMGERHG